MAAAQPDRAGRIASRRTALDADRRAALGSSAGLRLHAGRPRALDVADGGDRPGGDRLDGDGYADFGALRLSEDALHLLQAELCAGDEPADRSNPRRACDEPRVLHRTAAEYLRS